MQKLPNGGYAVSGYTNGHGGGSNDFVLFTFTDSLSGCGNLASHNMAVVSRDASNYSDLIFQDITFAEDFSYIATIPFNAVTPTVTDILPQLSTQNGRRICTLAERAARAAFSVSHSNDCGCSDFGVCDSSGNCECQAGYSGFRCSYSNSDYLSFTSEITD